MEFSRVHMYVFSGSGNTWLLSRAMARVFKANGSPTAFHHMPGYFILPEPGELLGFAFPTAYFSTYPFILDFLASLPDGAGQKTFMLTSMAASTGGMPQAVRRLLVGKNYLPVGCAAIKMPSNYGKNQAADTVANQEVITNGLARAEDFAGRLLAGKGRWPDYFAPFAGIMQKITARRLSCRAFRPLFKLQVVEKYCIKCGFCQNTCPTGAIEKTNDGYRHITAVCQSCQLCSAFCPTAAIRLPGQTTPSYKAAIYKEIAASFEQPPEQSNK